MALDGVSFGGKFAAYERYMQGAKTRMGLTPEQTREQFARYSEGLQYDQIKADKKAQGKAFGRELAAENAKARPAQAKPQATQVKPSEYYLDLAKRNEASYGNLDRHKIDLAVGVRRNENNYGKRNVHLQGAAKESYRKRYQRDLENLFLKEEVRQKADGKFKGITAEQIDAKYAKDKELELLNRKLRLQENHGKTSGVVEADNIAVRKRLENAEKELSKQKDIADRYKKLAQNKGKVSGVVIADEIASKKIEEQKVKDIVQKSAHTDMGGKVEAQGKDGGKVAEVIKGKKGGKIAKFLKGKGGKAALIGLAFAAIATGVGLLIHNNKKKAQEEEAVEKTSILPPAEEQETTPAAPPVDENDDKVNEDETVVPVDEAQPAEPAEEVVPTAPAEAEENPEDGLYTVVKGDCVWNIAKAKLARDLGRRPTNAEILKETHRIMAINPQLKWEPDHYHVLIKPGQKLNIAG